VGDSLRIRLHRRSVADADGSVGEGGEMKIFKCLRNLIAKRPRFVRIPDHVRIVGATFYVPEGMSLELGNYVILESCDVVYGKPDINKEQGSD
jgi:hypothetical protein